jgi:hypothetical protein
MSPRAACRLETLSFEQVYDYVPGKADWLARGLPREGEKAQERRAVELVRDDAVTCGLAERIGDVRERVGAGRSDHFANIQRSPADMGYFSIAEWIGDGPGWDVALWWNIVPAGIGNLIGGSLFVALPL